MIAPVGAAIGRPPVEICSDVKQNANAEEITYNITGRDTAIATLAIPNANRPSGEELLFPGVGGEKDEHGEDLEPAEEHIEAQHGLAQEAEP